MIQSNDLFKRVKSLFIVSEGNNTTNVSSSSDSKRNEIGSNPTTKTVFSSDDKEVGFNEKHIELLMSALEHNNIDGFDYLEYKNSLLSISSVITDESMRFKSAYEMAKTMGMDKKKLLDSANFYLNILSGEQKKFMDALENQKARQIETRVNTIGNLEKNIAEKKKMIENLNKELESISDQMLKLKQEINEEVQKIEITNKQFLASYNHVTGQITGDIEKINQNI